MRGQLRGLASGLRLASLLWCGSAPPAAWAQEGFAAVVEAAREAWARQDAPGIVASGRQMLVQLPGGEGQVAVGRDQAARLVAALLRRSEGVAVRLVSSREVGPGQGYAELRREYRVAGTGELLRQRILLAFRREVRGGWELVELRVLQGGG